MIFPGTLVSCTQLGSRVVALSLGGVPFPSGRWNLWRLPGVEITRAHSLGELTLPSQRGTGGFGSTGVS